MLFTNNIDPILVSFAGLQIHWYGVFFALGIIFCYLFLIKGFEKHGYPVEHVDSLAIYLFLGLLIGARLGQVFFYEPGYFLENPSEIVKVWHGGLSSHGATIGLFISYIAWAKVHKIKFAKYVDLIVVPIPIAAACVRIGNFFNSEIIGNPTRGNYGVIFKKLGETFPRHPAQLYEAALCLATFGVTYFLYKKYYGKLPQLFILSAFLLVYFGGRFVLEYFKDLHGPLPTDFPLSMGQVLSILPALAAVGYFVWLAVRKRK
ncbi:MAG: prolipoprotein diacylglyceryl transferase [Candidatus Peregrinibacteria bacterium]|nr:prolipoprotein diacylglyceryl transferase [Candidatus Peregrinibacteria bacterium]